MSGASQRFQRASAALLEAQRLARAGKLAEAEAIGREALAANPFSAEIPHVLAVILRQRGRADEALELMRQAVASAPNWPQLRVNLAVFLGESGRLDEALEQLLLALKLPGANTLPQLHNNLGTTLERLGRATEAIPSYRIAVSLWPDYAEAHVNLAHALRTIGRSAEAYREYHEALRLRPDCGKACEGLVHVASDLGHAQEAVSCLRKLIERDPDNAATRSSLLYTLHYLAESDPRTLYHEHVEWGRRFCDPLRQKIRPHENDRDPERRLRIGYVSPDFREHTPPKFIRAAFEHHDPRKFEIFCYSDVEAEDATTQHLRSLVECWRPIRGQSDRQVEELIRSDRIDILVDLRGHAAENRLLLFARKPAPIQVNMIGYFNTTGLSAMDYRITDALMDPPGQTEHLHTEKLSRIEPSCWCYWPGLSAVEGPALDLPDVAEPPALRNGYITFGTLNKLVKISRPCAELWAKVLEVVPGSKLMLSSSDAAGPQNAWARDFGELSRAAPMPQGIPPERLILLGKTATRREYLERYGQIDIGLDTFPFNGITVTCDALWMGVPVVSLSGGTSVSRAGKSILNAASLPELATDSPEVFVRTAIDLAGDLPRLRELRLGMRDRLLASPLMNHRASARKLEAAYRQMWRGWCAGCL